MMNNRAAVLVGFSALLFSAPVLAQDAPLPSDVIDTEANVVSELVEAEDESEGETPNLLFQKAPMQDYSTALIRALDKITARTETIELVIGDIVNFGALTITGKACKKSAPIEQPESAAFLQVWEIDRDDLTQDPMDNAALHFSGWMFASSPGLSAMDHPVYDIWVLDCVGDEIVFEDNLDEAESSSE